jgi:hypothetical protein
MRRALLVLAALTTFAACGGDADKPAETTTSTTATPSGTSSSSTLPPTTVTTTPTTTTTDPKQNGGATPKDAADGLETTWKANSRVNAVSWAEQPAIDALFSTPYRNVQEKDSNFKFEACEPNAGFGNQMTCSYTYRGGSMHMIMSNATGKWRAIEVRYVAD